MKTITTLIFATVTVALTSNGSAQQLVGESSYVIWNVISQQERNNYTRDFEKSRYDYDDALAKRDYSTTRDQWHAWNNYAQGIANWQNQLVAWSNLTITVRLVNDPAGRISGVYRLGTFEDVSTFLNRNRALFGKTSRVTVAYEGNSGSTGSVASRKGGNGSKSASGRSRRTATGAGSGGGGGVSSRVSEGAGILGF
ncbi:MAG: hypothetical protein P1V20_31110 [Verrucomicrobiales bacterium]|nr:hypothetical protein [Verrucomicrobiales bacterium]